MSCVLGIDCSTQSLTGTLIDLEHGSSFSHAISYIHDERLQQFCITRDTCTVLPRVPGEADQPPTLFLKALDCLFHDLGKDPRIDLAKLACINIAAQQHGQVYLAKHDAFERLHQACDTDLAAIFADSFSYQLSPIWMTSNTESQRKAMIAAYDGDIYRAIGSDLALRYSGVVIKRIAEQFPATYAGSKRIHLISSFLAGVLCGNSDAPIDIGNGAGTGLMNYQKKAWDAKLCDACLDATSLLEKLPPLEPPQKILGSIASYFSKKYGIAPDCQILAGSGDNCQTKSPIDGSLLSLGSSFVVMSDAAPHQAAAQRKELMRMYDGFGRAFTMVCKTNGTLVWDRFRQNHAYQEAEQLLAEKRFSSPDPLIYRPIPETFPHDPTMYTKLTPQFTHYPRIIESSLAELAQAWLSIYTKPELLYVTGGASTSPEILLRVSALWDCPVLPISDGGASYGAAYVAAKTIAGERNISFDRFDSAASKSQKNTIEADNTLKKAASRLRARFSSL